MSALQIQEAMRMSLLDQGSPSGSSLRRIDAGDVTEALAQSRFTHEHEEVQRRNYEVLEDEQLAAQIATDDHENLMMDVISEEMESLQLKKAIDNSLKETQRDYSVFEAVSQSLSRRGDPDGLELDEATSAPVFPDDRKPPAK